MSKIAFVYPGQGVQSAGMEKIFLKTASLRKRYIQRQMRYWILVLRISALKKIKK